MSASRRSTMRCSSTAIRRSCPSMRPGPWMPALPTSSATPATWTRVASLPPPSERASSWRPDPARRGLAVPRGRRSGAAAAGSRMAPARRPRHPGRDAGGPHRLASARHGDAGASRLPGASRAGVRVRQPMRLQHCRRSSGHGHARRARPLRSGPRDGTTPARRTPRRLGPGADRRRRRCRRRRCWRRSSTVGGPVPARRAIAFDGGTRTVAIVQAMHQEALFDRLRTALDRAARDGRAVRLWWRDDDAVAATPALDRLLSLADGRPLLIAAIPAGIEPSLGRRLARARNVRVAVHGLGHANHAPAGEKTAEFGPHRDRRSCAMRRAAPSISLGMPCPHPSCCRSSCRRGTGWIRLSQQS